MTDAESSARDQSALTTVTTRLAAAFPEVPTATMEASVLREYHRFDDSRIRAFVPLLVEHAVRNEFLSVRVQ
jgi:hypothetical protein